MSKLIWDIIRLNILLNIITEQTNQSILTSSYSLNIINFIYFWQNLLSYYFIRWVLLIVIIIIFDLKAESININQNFDFNIISESRRIWVCFSFLIFYSICLLIVTWLSRTDFILSINLIFVNCFSSIVFNDSISNIISLFYIIIRVWKSMLLSYNVFTINKRFFHSNINWWSSFNWLNLSVYE